VDRSGKQELVTALHQTLKETALVVITQQSGLTVGQVTNLRRQMREAGAGFKVTKNRLARLALKGTQFEGLESMFVGPTAIAYSKDPVAAAKVAVAYAKTNDKLVIIGGAMGGQVLDPAGIAALATMPSLDELRAKLVGMIQTPATRIAGVLAAPAGQLARVLRAYADKAEKGEAA
jgi:large subunit ribosomal protein L10